MRNPRPNLFVVGAPKCGTTTLDALLRQHPDIYMAEKEPHYFATDMRGRGRSVRVSDLDTYAERFGEATTESVVGETSPWYLYSSSAAENIFEYNPEAKILCVFRDPIDLIQSLHQMNVTNTTEDRVDLADALAVEARRHQGEEIPENTWLIWDLFYTDVVRFGGQLSRYESRFDSQRIRVLVFERFVSETDTVLEEVFEFLGVDPTVRPSSEAQNTAHPVRNLGIRQLIRRYRLGNLLDNIPPWLRGLGGEFLSLFTSSVDYERDPHSSTANRLREELADEVAALDERVSQNLYRWWSFESPE